MSVCCFVGDSAIFLDKIVQLHRVRIPSACPTPEKLRLCMFVHHRLLCAHTYSGSVRLLCAHIQSRYMPHLSGLYQLIRYSAGYLLLGCAAVCLAVLF